MLTSRLQTIANQIHSNEKISDIGTDHAYIPIYLVKERIVTSALCSDIHEGPYQIAKDNVKSYGFEKQIDVRLGGGLAPYEPHEMQTAIIAGMGGELIAKILKDDDEIAQSVERFILQPMTALDEIREYLYQNGFNIKKETLAREGKKYYVIMDVIHEKVPMPKMEYLYIGKELFANPPELLKGYLSHWEACWLTAVSGMEHATSSQENLEKYRYLLTKVREWLKNI